MSRDHKPDRPDEYARITRAGGKVLRHTEGTLSFGPSRVYTSHSLGGLAVSRALGDSVYRVEPHDKEWLVPPTPEIVGRPLQRGHDILLIVASDGLWDVFSNEAACTFVMDRYRERRADSDSATPKFRIKALEAIAKALVEEAYRKGSMDNITAMLFLL
jgi:protein phosphatase 2C